MKKEIKTTATQRAQLAAELLNRGWKRAADCAGSQIYKRGHFVTILTVA